MDDLAEQLAETNLNERRSRSLTNYLRQRETLGKRKIPFRLVPESEEKEELRNKYDEMIDKFQDTQNEINRLKRVKDSYLQYLNEQSPPYAVNVAMRARRRADKELEEQYEIKNKLEAEFSELSRTTILPPFRSLEEGQDMGF